MAATLKVWLTDRQAKWFGYEPNTPVYFVDYDLEADDFLSSIQFSNDRDDAKIWPTTMGAIEEWRTQSVTTPLRDDEKPNRPLTAFTVEIEVLP